MGWSPDGSSGRHIRSQRIRWQKGTMESMLLHKNLFLNPRYGLTGLLSAPYFVIFEMFGPIIEFSGYLVFAISVISGMIDAYFAIIFLTAAVLYGIALSVLSVILEELSFKKYPKVSHLLLLFCTALLESFGYRQINTWWRFRAIFEYVFGSKTWGKMEKKGFAGPH